MIYCNQQKEIQLQEELQSVGLKLDLETNKRKKSEDDNKMLLRRLKESRTSLTPVTGKIGSVSV